VFEKKEMSVIKDTEEILIELEQSNHDEAQMSELVKIIDNNNYVQSCETNKSKEFNSLSYLISMDMSQSDCIKLGNALESVLRDIIINYNKNLENIKPKNKKGTKEKDHLFVDDNTKTIYYAELKSNLNLDTEKCKSTSNKCIQILDELKHEYPDYEIKMFLVGLRYYEAAIIPKVIKQKYTSISDNLVGVNEYLTKLGTGILFSYENKYAEFLNILTMKMFS